MEDDFYASIKLISGEEVFAKVAACDEDDRTMLLLHHPIIIKEIKLPGADIPAGYKVEPWIKTSSEDLYVLNMSNVMTMTECNDIEMIMMHQRYIHESDEKEGTKSHIDRKMGYISSVSDAKKMLEKLFLKDIKDS